MSAIEAELKPTQKQTNSPVYTSWANEAVEKQRAYFNTGATRSYEFRLAQLKKLKRAVIKYQDQVVTCLKEDIGRPPFEAALETVGVIDELNHTIKSLKKWMKPKRVMTSLMTQPGSSRIEQVPLGVCFVLGPYNYPFMLTMQPIVGAIAAGNTIILKPSSLNPKISNLLVKIAKECFSEEYFTVFEGSTEITNVLLEEKFDHIFFTGSPRVGKIIMAAAAKHLTPVVLELGGKSPTVVHHDAKLLVAARRILAGKMMNSGQTCVAPDYLYVHSQVYDKFVECLKKVLIEFYGEKAIDSPDFGRMINDKHFHRVKGLIDPSKVYFGGDTDEAQKFIAPTLLTNVSLDDRVMQEEIFGPLLPVLKYDQLSEVYETVKKLPSHPLACYIFSESKSVQKDVLANIQFGGGCINNAIIHVGNGHLPFGGVGESGMGNYHGHASFETFSHQRSILTTPTFFDIKIRYAPYKGKSKLLKLLIR